MATAKLLTASGIESLNSENLPPSAPDVVSPLVEVEVLGGRAPLCAASAYHDEEDFIGFTLDDPFRTTIARDTRASHSIRMRNEPHEGYY